MKDPYETLGVNRSATDKEIKDAFKKLARKFHPDLHPGDKEAEAKVQGHIGCQRPAQRQGEAPEVRCG